MKILYIGFLFLTISTFGQINKFDTLTNNILLRINTHETNHATKNFLLKYVPFLVEKPSKNNFWSAYPPIEDSMPTYTVGHSILFPKHPFVDFGTNACRLDFLTNEKNNKIIGYKTYFITFFFANKQKAMNSFKALCSEYDGLSSKKNMEIKTDKKIGTYENMVEGSLFKSVEFILTKDDFFDHKYKIVFGEILNFKLEDYYSN